MNLEIPHSLKREHEELHSAVVHATNERGAIGEAARRVARLLQPHFAKEENYVLPAVGALAKVARGMIDSEMQEIVALGEHLHMDLENMLAEHRMIAAAVEEMMTAARHEDKVEYAELGIRLITHAQTEEQLTYPAVIVLANYLKIRLGL